MDRRGNFEDQFEKSWQEAFEEIGQEPPSSVWKDIDRQLAYEELATMKSKNRLYRYAVAALVLLASFLGLSQYFYFASEQQERIISGAINVDEPRYEAFDITVPNEVGDASVMRKKAGNGSGLVPVADDDDHSLTPYTIFEIARVEPDLEQGSMLEKEMYRRPVYIYHARKNRTSEPKEKFWAGVDVGSGGFDPNYESANTSLIVTNASAMQGLFSNARTDAVEKTAPELREGMNAGQTVALGVNFGVKLSSKWSIESGVQYTRADATTTTNIVIESSKVQEVIPASAEVRSIPKVQSILSAEDVLEYDYQDVDMANRFQFATVPLKAGYMLVDHKVKVKINAGLAANLYLGNTLTDPDNQIREVTIGPGDSSPYREISFSGLAGVQLGYKFMDHFDVVLEPNYRQSINSLTKENSSFTANPSGFGVMTGIRYNFH